MARTARKERELDHTRHEILRAAARAAAKSGFDTLTIRDIAKETGYTVGTLYKYFDGKQAILDGLHQQLTELVLATMQSPMPQGLTFRQKIELLLQRQLELATDWRDAIVTLMAVIWGTKMIPVGIQASSDVIYEGMVKWVRAHASAGDLEDRTPVEVALFYFAVIQSVIVVALQEKRKQSMDTLLPRTMRLLFEGLGNAPNR